MKQVLSSILAVVVLIAFSNCKQPAAPAPTTSTDTPAASMGHKIGYVNIDTLYEKYTWFKDQKAGLEAKVTNAQKTLEQREAAFIKKVQAFQEKAQSGNVPPIQLEKEQSVLAKEEQDLQRQQGKLAQNLEEESRQANEQLLASLESKLKEIQSQLGYDYILGYQRGNPTILLANEQLDVTNKVLELLNAQTTATGQKK